MGDVVLSILHSIDIFILESVNLSYHNIILDNLALLVSNMGVIYFWIIITIILYFFGGVKEKNISKKMIIVLIFIVIFTQAIKYIVMRPRPYTELSSLVLLSLGTDPSFPSGHTSISTAMSFVLSKGYENYYFMLIPCIVGFSRLYIGVHYPSDVLGGFILGLIVVYLVERFLKFKNVGNIT